MAKYDTDLIKDTARGQWAPLFASIGIPQESIDSASETACPKCGGGTRFRMVDRDAGALYCSHCFTSKNGDGIAAVQWWQGSDFKTAVALVADHFGIKPSTNGKAATNGKPATNGKAT